MRASRASAAGLVHVAASGFNASGAREPRLLPQPASPARAFRPRGQVLRNSIFVGSAPLLLPRCRNVRPDPDALPMPRRWLPAFPVALSVTFTVLFSLFLSPGLPFALLRPLPSPLVAPPGRLVLGPLLPMSRGDTVVVHRHEQDGPGHDLRGDDDPRAVVSGAHVPAAIGKGPVLAVVEEEVGGGGRHVLDRSDLRYDNQLRRRGKMDTDVDMHLSAGRRSQPKCQQGDDEHVHECSSYHMS